jgi:hypothetical protein
VRLAAAGFSFVVFGGTLWRVMSVPVTFENEALRIEIYPQIGAKVASVLDKADKFELLFDYAAELPTRSAYDRPYAQSWFGGWDECFPAIAPGPYPTHPYQNVPVPDHGELWGLPPTAMPTKDGITTVWHGLRFGYTLTRKLYLDGPSVVAEYSLVNLAPFDFRFVWSQHGLLSLAAPVEIDIGETTCRIAHDHNGNEINVPLRWPQGEEAIDFSRPASLPGKQGWKIFTERPIASAATISYPSRGRRLTIEYTSPDSLDAYWGVWLNSGGWMGHKHFALEPTTGRHDQLDRSMKDNSAGRVDASGKRDWTVRWTVG